MSTPGLPTVRAVVIGRQYPLFGMFGPYRLHLQIEGLGKTWIPVPRGSFEVAEVGATVSIAIEYHPHPSAAK